MNNNYGLQAESSRFNVAEFDARGVVGGADEQGHNDLEQFTSVLGPEPRQLLYCPIGELLKYHSGGRV